MFRCLSTRVGEWELPYRKDDSRILLFVPDLICRLRLLGVYLPVLCLGCLTPDRGVFLQGRPEEADELSSDGDDRVGFALPTFAQDAPDRRAVPVLVGGLHEDPADMGVAGLGDAATADLLGTSVFAGDHPQVRHQLARRGEPLDAVQLGDDRHGRDRADAPEAPQRSDRHLVGLLLREGLQLRRQILQPALRGIHSQQIVAEDHTIRFTLPADGHHPSAMALRPGAPASAKQITSSQKNLPQPVPAPGQILQHILPAADEISYRFLLDRRWPDFRQESRSKQLQQLAGITPVRLDTLPRLDRDQRRRHHHAPHPQRLDLSLQRVPARPRLVAEDHLTARLSLRLPHHPLDRRRLVDHIPLNPLLSARVTRSYPKRPLTRIHRHVTDTFVHDRLLSYAALTPRLTRDLATASRSFPYCLSSESGCWVRQQ